MVSLNDTKNAPVLAAGTKVAADFDGVASYPGTITTVVQKDGETLYDIQFDDGDFLASVPRGDLTQIDNGILVMNSRNSYPGVRETRVAQSFQVQAGSKRSPKVCCSPLTE